MGIALLMTLAIGCDRDGDGGEPGSARKIVDDKTYEASQPLRAVVPGDQVWAVYTYAGNSGPAMEQAVDKLVAQGLDRADVQRRELACQEGAKESLSLSGDALAVSVYFGDEASALKFGQLISAPLANVVHIKYMCKM
jgi:hypothetical protein